MDLYYCTKTSQPTTSVYIFSLQPLKTHLIRYFQYHKQNKTLIILSPQNVDFFFFFLEKWTKREDNVGDLVLMASAIFLFPFAATFLGMERALDSEWRLSYLAMRGNKNLLLGKFPCDARNGLSFFFSLFNNLGQLYIFCETLVSIGWWYNMHATMIICFFFFLTARGGESKFQTN